MLKIKGFEKLLSVNPQLGGIEEFKDRYRLHILSEGSDLPLLLDIHKPLSESNEVSIRLHCVSTDNISIIYFPLNCSLRTFSDTSTFSQYLDILIETWRRGSLSGSPLGGKDITPNGYKLGEWGFEKGFGKFNNF